MPTKYKRQTRRTKSRKLKKLRNSRKIKGGALSERTIELLRNQYQGINRDRRDRPTILELNQFMIDNNIQEPLADVMELIRSMVGFLMPLPGRASDAEVEEADRLHRLF